MKKLIVIFGFVFFSVFHAFSHVYRGGLSKTTLPNGNVKIHCSNTWDLCFNSNYVPPLIPGCQIQFETNGPWYTIAHASPTDPGDEAELAYCSEIEVTPN